MSAQVALLQDCQDCPYVVRLEGAYEDERSVYLVQELCWGGDVRALLQVRARTRVYVLLLQPPQASQAPLLLLTY
jgi:serine/threonine protein kinase